MSGINSYAYDYEPVPDNSIFSSIIDSLAWRYERAFNFGFAIGCAAVNNGGLLDENYSFTTEYLFEHHAFISYMHGTTGAVIYNHVYDFLLDGESVDTAYFGGIVTVRSTGELIADASIKWGENTISSDSSGHYLFSQVPCGTNTLTVTAVGYETYSVSHTPPCLSSSELNIELTPISAVEGETDILTWSRVFSDGDYHGYISSYEGFPILAQQTSDGDYIIVTDWLNSNRDPVSYNPRSELYVFKLDAEGDKIWEKHLSDEVYHVAALKAVRITSDNRAIASKFVVVS